MRARRLMASTVAFGGVLLPFGSMIAASAESRSKGDLIAGTPAVVDSRTFDFAAYRTRIWGIDAPESGSWCFRNGDKWKPAAEATEALRKCLKGKIITCRVQKVERRWFRMHYVSECWSDDGQDVGDCMIEGGWATDYTCYSDGYYRDRETEARNKGLGLWACDNGPPTRRWGRKGQGALCETPPYKPSGPATR